MAAARLLLVAAGIFACSASATSAQRPSILTFFAKLRDGNDVTWLERVAKSQSGLAAAWVELGSSGRPTSDLRGEAYARLGAVGTDASLAAIRRIEAALSAERTLAGDLAAEVPWPHPAPGMSDSILGATESVRVGSRQFMARIDDIYGPYSPYVRVATGDGQLWSRPLLAGAPVERAWSFAAQASRRGDVLVFAFAPRDGSTLAAPPPLDVPIERLTRDTDNDGWTDYEEAALGLDPEDKDSDDDGLTDDRDGSPLYRAPATEAADPEAFILRRAMFAVYGLRGSRAAIFGLPGSRPVQLSGFAGPVFFDHALPNRLTHNGRGMLPPDQLIRGGMQAAWTIVMTETEATVSFDNYAAAQFRSGISARLRRFGNEWIVVELRRGYVT